MSCNGCRVLRKGCGEDCILRQCLGWIGNPQAQANATIFVAKFFGRAGLMSFISSVPRDQRPSLFQSLLFEAVGRTVNPVSGAVGLLWTGNWQVCQTAVVTVLRRGTIEALPEFEGGSVLGGPELDNVSECVTDVGSRPQAARPNGKRPSSSSSSDIDASKCGHANLDLCLAYRPEKIRRAGTPSEESDTTTSKCDSSNTCGLDHEAERRVLRLFV